MEKEIRIGTSGWHYKHWVGPFYPTGTKPKDFTDHYIRHFDTVEINNSFYKLPSAETFSNWKLAVPENFLFSVKASRYITHMKKLKDPQESIVRFFENVNALEEKLGPILFQLPPGWTVNEERLGGFLAALPTHYRYTFEFRHSSWYSQKVLDLLQNYNAAFCIYDLDFHLSPLEVTADFVYVRLHGPGAKYAGSYSEKSLAGWARQCITWQRDGLDVFVYFDNDLESHAAFNARRLQELIQEQIMSEH